MTLLVLAIFVQVLDALTFLLAYERFGITGELNPFARWMYEMGGLAGVMAPKIIAVTMVSLIIVAIEPNHKEAAKMGALALLIVGLLGWGLNTLSLLVG